MIIICSYYDMIKNQIDNQQKVSLEFFTSRFMFDFLKKPTHQHGHANLPNNQNEKLPNIQLSPSKSMSDNAVFVQLKPQQLSSQSNKKKPARVKQYQHNSQVHLSEQVQKSLKELLTNAKDSIENTNITEEILKQMQIRERTAFTLYTSYTEQEYLSRLYQKTSAGDLDVMQGLDDLIMGTVEHIADDIESNRQNYEVFKKKFMTKDELLQQRINHIQSIKLKQGEISSKVGELRMELHIVQDPKVVGNAKSIVEKQTYSKNIEKTKQIEKFIELRKQQKQEIERKKREDQEKKKLKEIQQKLIEQANAEKAKSQRHAKLVQQFEEKQMMKQKRQEEIQTQKQRFARFLKEFRNAKPLYQQKIEEQIKREIQQKKLRFEKMLQRKSKYNSMSLKEIEQFEQKYLQLKRQQQQKKKIQFSMRKEEQECRQEQIKKKHYKGRYRYLILEEMVNKQAQADQEEFIKKLLLQKKRTYSVDIKEKFKPKIDENKRIESDRFAAQSEKKRKHRGTRRVRLNSSNLEDLNTVSYQTEQLREEPNPRKQGQKNMRLFKQYIREKIQKGQIKRHQTFQSQVSVFTPRIDYLKEQRQNRSTKNSLFSYRSLDAESRVRKIKNQVNGDFTLFKLKANELDEKARRQELKLKYSQHTPIEEKELEQNYLASIKAKLELLSNVK